MEVFVLDILDDDDVKTAKTKAPLFFKGELPLRVYLHLGQQAGLHPLVVKAVARSLNAFPGNVRRAIASLEKNHWASRSKDNQILLLQPQLDLASKSVQRFSGHPVLTIYGMVDSLVGDLKPWEERTLYECFATEPLTAALYRHLRAIIAKRDDGDARSTVKGIADLFHCTPTTLKNRLLRLQDKGMVQLDYRSGTIELKPSTPDGKVMNVGEEELATWLNGPASVPTLRSANDARVGTKTIGAQSALVLNFFDKASVARNRSRGVDAPAPGSKTMNERVARNLVRNQTFKQLMPILLFYILEWRGEAVDEYGRTLMTFQKNYPAVLDEFTGSTASDQNYVATKMISYGLDAFFPTPEIKAKKAKVEKLSAANISMIRINGYDMDLYEEDSLEAAWLREHGMAS